MSVCRYAAICDYISVRKVGLYKKDFTMLNNMYIIKVTMKKEKDKKAEALREKGALHRHPEAVKDEPFLSHPFFDPRDLVQVRYEMLRRHRVDEKAVKEVASTFGLSRQAFYEAEAAFEHDGVAGLLPRHKGPKRPHKCTDEVLNFVEAWRQTSPREGVGEAVFKRFGIRVNPRSIDRALARRKKKRQTKGTAR